MQISSFRYCFIAVLKLPFKTGMEALLQISQTEIDTRFNIRRFYNYRRPNEIFLRAIN